jgi:hypothetical protein
MAKLYAFWNIISPIWQTKNFIIVTGRAPALFALGRGQQFVERESKMLISPGWRFLKHRYLTVIRNVPISEFFSLFRRTDQADILRQEFPLHSVI